MNEPSHLLGSDARWSCHNIVELVSASFDPDKAGIGSTPFVGDMSATGIVVPEAATIDQSHRYLFRLCGVQIPMGRAIILRGLRQLATIRQVELIEPEDILRPVELEVTSPGWSFTDGNISWHLRYTSNALGMQGYDTAQVAGTSPDTNGFDSALLYVPPLVPYVPPSAGRPPGQDVEGLGTWRDMRYPWQHQYELEQLIKGPGMVVFYASVHQTDPETRPILTVSDPGSLRPEDRFLGTFQLARYGRVAGAMSVETLPCCPEDF